MDVQNQAIDVRWAIKRLVNAAKAKVAGKPIKNYKLGTAGVELVESK